MWSHWRAAAKFRNYLLKAWVATLQNFAPAKIPIIQYYTFFTTVNQQPISRNGRRLLSEMRNQRDCILECWTLFGGLDNVTKDACSQLVHKKVQQVRLHVKKLRSTLRCYKVRSITKRSVPCKLDCDQQLLATTNLATKCAENDLLH